jgi:hypothetical protein
MHGRHTRRQIVGPRDLAQVTASFIESLGAGKVDEDPAHQPGSERKEVGPVRFSSGSDGTDGIFAPSGAFFAIHRRSDLNIRQAVG